MIIMAHGAGGLQTSRLIREHFQPRFTNPILDAMEDSGVVDGLALTTDGYVVTPRVFPGGDLGRLAVCGTVNDLCASGARPLGLAAAFILEEGLALAELDPLLDSMAAAAREAGVDIVAGDTKVVPRGSCDGLFITTSGFGKVDPDFRPRPSRARPGDQILVSGTIGDHGMAVLAARERFGVAGAIVSDVAPISGLVDSLRALGDGVRCLRDPTRGGVAQSVLEFAGASGVRIVLEEESLPVRLPVRGACELLGLDPLYVANEGKVLVVVSADVADSALQALRRHAYGGEAVRIGRVEEGASGCEIHTAIGGRRTLRMFSGEQLPRIC